MGHIRQIRVVIFCIAAHLALTFSQRSRSEMGREYLRKLESQGRADELRSSLLRLQRRLEESETSNEEEEEQIERNIPRASDIWRNKVKEFLASRIEQDDQTTEKESEFLTEKEENEGEEEEKNTDDNNWVTLEAEDGQSFEVQKDEGGFLLPDTFLSPPLGDIVVGDSIWRDSFQTEDEKTTLNFEQTTEMQTIKNSLEYLQHFAKTSGIIVRPTTTPAPAQAEVVEAGTEATECQSAADCKSNQVCYLPTNTCKDQLIMELSQMSSCTKSSDCNDNEICYLDTKTCVCALGYTEEGGACISLSTLDCSSTKSLASQVVDDNLWGVQPYCEAWGVKSNSQTKVSFGTFTSGTGLTDDPMIFTNGSSESCGTARSGELYFSCYCEEYGCSSTTLWNQTSLWWGEFNPCVYSAYVFTPLACTTMVA